MKASTLFIISIAVLIGLGTFGVAKYVGLFKGPTAPAPVKEEPTLVLVANSDLYEGVAVAPADVRVRELRPSERQFYIDNQTLMMPGSVAAVNMRVPNTQIRADTPLLRTMFEEKAPDKMGQRLQDGMRAVNVAVTKENSAGGIIQVGEYVDVWLTSKINDLSDPTKIYLKTARLDRDCKVIMKRNNRLVVMAVDPAEKPIPFTLQANPYRAALIDYAKYKGQLSLMPVPAKTLQDTMDETKSPVDMTSAEYKDEDARINLVKRGEYVVGDQDLERIFRIRPPAPPIPPIAVLEIKGVTPVGYEYFGDHRAAGGTNLPYYVPLGSKSNLTSNFQYPNAAGANGAGANGAGSSDYCPTCDKTTGKPATTGAAPKGAVFGPPAR